MVSGGVTRRRPRRSRAERASRSLGEDLVERLGVVGRRAVEAFTHLCRRRASDRRFLALEPLDQQVDRAVAQFAHGLGIERQWIVVVRPPCHGACIVALGWREWKWSSSATARPSGAATGRHTGRTDVPLTEEGERQARAVGEALAGASSRSSCRARCYGRGRPRRLAGFEPEVRDDLAEWDYGEYDGVTTPRDPRAGARLDDLAVRGSRRRERRAARRRGPTGWSRSCSESTATCSSSRTATSCGC